MKAQNLPWFGVVTVIAASLAGWASADAAVAALAAIALISAMLAMGAFWSSRALWILALACLPLVLDVDAGRLTLMNFMDGTSVDAGNTRVHVAFLVIGLATAPTLLSGVKTRRPPLPGGLLVLLIALTFTASITYGLMTGAGVIGVVFYVQSMVPLLAWFVMARAEVSLLKVAAVVMASTISTLVIGTAFALLHGSMSDPISASLQIETIIPQFRSYFPAIEMAAVAFAITYWDVRRRLCFLTLLVCGLTLPLMWSRGGLAMVGIACIVAFILRPGKLDAVGRMLMLLVGAGIAGYAAQHIFAVSVLGQRQQNAADLAASDASRLDLAREAISRLWSNPVFGDAFRPYSADLLGGESVDFARLFPTHNQYLDYALRGGVGAAVLLVAVLSLSAWRAFLLARTSSSIDDMAFHGGLVSIIVALSVGNMGELYLTQTWTGCVLFGLLGVAAGHACRQVRAASHQPELVRVTIPQVRNPQAPQSPPVHPRS